MTSYHYFRQKFNLSAVSFLLFFILAAFLTPDITGTTAFAKSSSPLKTADNPESTIKKAPMSKPGNTTQKKAVLPDLKVERIWRDQNCVLHLRIKNRGKGVIPDKQFDKARLQVAVGTDKKTFYLKQIDPKGRLRKPNGKIDTASGIKVKQPEKVSVFIDSSRAVKESDEKNTKQIMLGLCKKNSKTSARSTSNPAKIAAARKQKEIRSTGRILDAAKTMKKEMSDSVLFIDGPTNIEFISPRLGRNLNRGGSLTVEYKILEYVSVIPDIEFRLVYMDVSFPSEVPIHVHRGESRASDPDEVRSFTIPLPYGISIGRVHLTAEGGSSLIGQSDTFWIQREEGDLEIEVYQPALNQRFYPGSDISVVHSTPVPAPASVTIRLSNLYSGHTMDLYSGPPRGSYRVAGPPESWPANDHYILTVLGSDGSVGMSQPFIIRPYALTVEQPNGGEIRRTRTSPWQFRWDADPGIDKIEAYIIKNNVEMHHWTPHGMPESLSGDELLISPGQDWHPAGTDYKIRIEGYIENPDDPSAYILVAMDESDGNFEVIDDWEPPAPSSGCSYRRWVNIRHPHYLPENRWYVGQTYPIQWCVAPADVIGEDITHVRVSAIGPDGDTVVIDSNAPCTNRSSLVTWTTDADGGTLDWTIPEDIRPGRYQIQVETLDGGHVDQSDGPIYIMKWSTVSAPSGGEVYQVGDTIDIRWESGGLDGERVRIKLSSLSYGFYYRYYYIAETLPNTGRSSWTIDPDALPEAVTELSDLKIEVMVGDYRSWSGLFTIHR